MGAILGSTILTRVQRTLLDDAGQPSGGEKRWTLPELLEWLGAGIRELVKFKPDAAVKNQDFSLAAGVKQSLPSDGQLLVDVRGKTSAITPVSLVDMDHSLFGWRAVAAGTTIHYMHDERDPHVFYVYPPAVASAVVEIVYGFIPDYTDASDPIPVDDNYDVPLYDFVLARAYEKNSKRGDKEKSLRHDQKFAAGIGVKEPKQYSYAGGVKNDAAAQ